MYTAGVITYRMPVKTKFHRRKTTYLNNRLIWQCQEFTHKMTRQLLSYTLKLLDIYLEATLSLILFVEIRPVQHQSMYIGIVVLVDIQELGLQSVKFKFKIHETHPWIEQPLTNYSKSLNETRFHVNSLKYLLPKSLNHNRIYNASHLSNHP